MNADATMKVLIVGQPTIWRRRVVQRLTDACFDVLCVDRLEDAVQLVKDDPEIKRLAIFDDLELQCLIQHVSQIVVARPELRIFYCPTVEDTATVVKLAQLGRVTPAGPTINYAQNRFNYEWLLDLFKPLSAYPAVGS